MTSMKSTGRSGEAVSWAPNLRLRWRQGRGSWPRRLPRGWIRLRNFEKPLCYRALRYINQLCLVFFNVFCRHCDTWEIDNLVSSVEVLVPTCFGSGFWNCHLLWTILCWLLSFCFFLHVQIVVLILGSIHGRLVEIKSYWFATFFRWCVVHYIS